MTTPPQLEITVDGRTYPVIPAEAPITLGREFPSQILLADQRISRVHLRVEVAAGHWVGVDLSRNGVFLAGTRQASFPLADGLTVRLGNPDGIPVTFGLRAAPASTAAAPGRSTLTSRAPVPRSPPAATSSTCPGECWPATASSTPAP